MKSADLRWTAQPPNTLLSTLVINLGVRPRPMNRADPLAGHWVVDCPSCGWSGAIWIAPRWHSFEALCGCWKGRGDVFAFYHLLRGGR